MEIKYLNDGRKVQVVGKLNSQEMIVQEIFVTKSGDEIPSGESFTSRSLHDEPVLSYKQKEEERVKLRIEALESEEKKHKIEKNKILQSLKGYRDVLKQTKKLVELFPEQDLDTLTSFMTGTIEYLVVEEYSYIQPPTKMIDEIIRFESNYGERRYDSIKMCTVLGSSNGDTEYRINQYSDGSGSSTMKVVPFNDYGEAVLSIEKRAEKLIDDKRLDKKGYEECLKMGIRFTEKYDNKYKENQNEVIKNRILNQKEQIKKAQENIKEYESELI